MEIPYGYCHCGCGNQTKIAKNNIPERESVRGKPHKFIRGHNNIANHPHNWKGGKVIDYFGYVMIKDPNHPRAKANGYIMEHLLIAEKTLGKLLPPKVIVHHYGGKLENNKIVICENQAYHLLLHKRARAYKACGHADWLKCVICKNWDKPENIFRSYHRECRVKYDLKRRCKL